VSFDAATPETYKVIRGGDYKVVEQNVMNFLELKERKGSVLPFLRVTFVEMDENKHEIGMFKERWEGLADIIDVQKMFDFSVVQRDPALIQEIDYGNYDCVDPYYLIVIKHDGQMLPCCKATYEATSAVYVQDIGLLDYWNSPQTLKFFDSIQQKRYIDCCKRCMASIKL
jgi:radical SAM protein with 4Fe4S-binding SPASM domain